MLFPYDHIHETMVADDGERPHGKAEAGGQVACGGD
jgi:hypothetical protein